MELKDIIKSRRLALNITLEEVAEIVGVSRATVSRWESGNISNMRRDRIALLADALRTSPDYIMGLTDDPNPVIEKPAPIAESELDNSLIKLLVKLTPDEIKQVDAFVQGLIAARKA